MPMRRVILESPYAGDIAANELYARKCLHDCLMRGEAPLASHLLYTQPHVLDEHKPEERKLGIDAGHSWYSVAEACVVYEDLGVSKGMLEGIKIAEHWNLPIERRYLPEAMFTGNRTANKFQVGKRFKNHEGAIIEITAIATHCPGYNWLTGRIACTVDGVEIDPEVSVLRVTFNPEGKYSDFGESRFDLVEEVQ